MTIQKIYDMLEQSSESAAVAVKEHLETVASNGREYATRKAQREEALALRDWANRVAQELE
jgi:hypothetical protein